jgi:D-3-phosphoglycerate dehydrogenase
MDLLARSGNEVVIPNDGNSDHIIEYLRNADAFILRIGKIDAKAIEQCSKLKVITRPGVGVDNVDVKCATKHGIPVVICPGVNAVSVAEHTIALLFACAKNLIESYEETLKGNFAIRSKYCAMEVSGKVLAILGFGHIGQNVARMAFGIGMKVVVYDPFYTEEQIEKFGYQYATTIDDAISIADFVTLHMPSLPETKKMVNARFLNVMKKSAFLINCARGDIVDEEALYMALEKHWIAGAGVDVLDTEPMDINSPLMKLSNFIVSPHMAAQTVEATTKTVTMAVEGTLAVLAGERWKNVCNPEVYETDGWKKRTTERT